MTRITQNMKHHHSFVLFLDFLQDRRAFLGCTPRALQRLCFKMCANLCDQCNLGGSKTSNNDEGKFAQQSDLKRGNKTIAHREIKQNIIKSLLHPRTVEGTYLRCKDATSLCLEFICWSSDILLGMVPDILESPQLQVHILHF